MPSFDPGPGLFEYAAIGTLLLIVVVAFLVLLFA
jgi:hypothetical protein